MLDRIENRLQARAERFSDAARYFNRDGLRSALDVGLVPRADGGPMGGSLLGESEGFAPCLYCAPELASIDDRMMDEEQNDRPGTIVPIEIGGGAKSIPYRPVFELLRLRGC